MHGAGSHFTAITYTNHRTALSLSTVAKRDAPRQSSASCGEYGGNFGAGAQSCRSAMRRLRRAVVPEGIFASER